MYVMYVVVCVYVLLRVYVVCAGILCMVCAHVCYVCMLCMYVLYVWCSCMFCMCVCITRFVVNV